MSNYHFKEKEMSLKAKGLLSLMLSLPDDWDYTIEGLVAICKENRTSITNALNELKDFHYLEIKKTQNSKGQFDYIYNIYEQPRDKKPDTENPCMDNLDMENPVMENQLQLNTNNKVLKNKILNNKLTNNNIIDLYNDNGCSPNNQGGAGQPDTPMQFDRNRGCRSTG
jgi:predicted transcriptional regulator